MPLKKFRSMGRKKKPAGAEEGKSSIGPAKNIQSPPTTSATNARVVVPDPVFVKHIVPDPVFSKGGHQKRPSGTLEDSLASLDEDDSYSPSKDVSHGDVSGGQSGSNPAMDLEDTMDDLSLGTSSSSGVVKQPIPFDDDDEILDTTSSPLNPSSILRPSGTESDNPSNTSEDEPSGLEKDPIIEQNHTPEIPKDVVPVSQPLVDEKSQKPDDTHLLSLDGEQEEEPTQDTETSKPSEEASKIKLPTSPTFNIALVENSKHPNPPPLRPIDGSCDSSPILVHPTHLWFQMCNLTDETIPESLWESKYLHSLSLAYNSLTMLSPSVSSLSMLLVLDLSNNLLSSLPSTISQLTRLKHLFCSFNSLKTIPYSINQLENLEVFWLDHNQLESLPSSLNEEPLATNLSGCYAGNARFRIEFNEKLPSLTLKDQIRGPLALFNLLPESQIFDQDSDNLS